MRKAQNLQKVPYQTPDVVTKPIPSPTDGWDALSPLALMDPKRAPILINWVPRPGWVELRGGYNIWATTGATYLTGSPVETLLIYRALGVEKMFAASGGNIYDCSTQFAAPPIVVAGLANNRWQWCNFTPAGGATVIQLVNGSDSLRQYNGSVWSTPSITGLPGGLTTASIRNISAQKRRLWYVLNSGSGGGSTLAAFMPVDAISGPIAGTIDLGAFWTKGGFLQTIFNWTVDGGTGPDDYLAFMSSQGQTTLYKGTDPLSVNTWSIVGTFDLPPPIGDRCATRIGADVAVITQQGVIPISTALPFDPSADRSIAITTRIQNAMSQAANSYNKNFGWQITLFPLQTLLILNIPQFTNLGQIQYVMNTLTGAWCQFNGWAANCFEIFEGDLFFGDNLGNVNLAYSGGSDLFSTVNCDMQCAFNYFDDPGRIKRVTMVQPLLTVQGNISPSISIDSNFGASSAGAPVAAFSAGATVWDSAIWDTSTWPIGIFNSTSWLSVNAVGHALAVRMKINFSSGVGPSSGVFDIGTFDNAQFDVGIQTANPILQVNAFNTIMELGGYI